MSEDRRTEVINICLDHFIEQGLFETSTRSLSKALKLQSAGLYNYFSSKDEAVIVCAEQAAIRLEDTLISPAMKDLADPERMMRRLRSRADEMAPTMKFLVSVCSSERYKDDMKPVLDRLAERYEHYTEKTAQKLGCSKEDVEPYVYMTITAVTNYMIFAEDGIIAPQMRLVKDAIFKLREIHAAESREEGKLG